MPIFRFMSQIHLWLGVIVGAQVMLWLISGLFMVLWPIETVRGEHLRTPPAVETLDWLDAARTPGAIAAQLDLAVTGARTGTLAGRPVWHFVTPEGMVTADAVSGERLSPVPMALALEIAEARYSGAGTARGVSWHETPPREAGLGVPAWRVDFNEPDAASFYINAQTGELRAVRTTLWRAFDVMWGLHIMDWSTRENFNSWWIKATSVFAVLFALAGVVLTVLRLKAMMRKRRAVKRAAS